MNTSINNRTSQLSAIFILLGLFYSGIACAQIKAGGVTELSGQVWAQTKGQRQRQLGINDPVFEHDMISTERYSSIKIKLRDESRFELGPEARFEIKEFRYKQKKEEAEEEEEESVSMSILRGAFRFVSGLIAKKKPRSMSVSTTVATIGIRGTDVVGEVTATSAIIILKEPEDPTQKTAIEVSNKFGTVTIDEPGYGTEIPDEFSPPSPPRRMRLQTITNIMRSMQTIQRINVPRPRMH